jgi:hypothetical protein
MPRPKETVAPVLSALELAERSRVLDQLLAAHRDLVEEAERTATGILGHVAVDEVAEELMWAVEALELDDLASRAGPQAGGGYVHETEAAYELVEELVLPYVDDMQRRAKLGLHAPARVLAPGTVVGLYRCAPASDGKVLGYAGEDTLVNLADRARREAADARVDLPADQLATLCPDWSPR